MNDSIMKCRECGLWYFNWKKLSNHLVLKHEYVIPMEEESDELPHEV